MADSQWDTTACKTTDTCVINSKNPGTAYRIPAGNGTITWQQGQYIGFVPNGGANAATYPWKMTLFNADGSVAETMGVGRALTAGTDSSGNSYFFFVGSDEHTGQLFSGSFGMDSTAGITFTGNLEPTLAELDAFAAGLSTKPLAAGEVFVPTSDSGDGALVPVLRLSTMERVLMRIDAATNLAQVNGTFVNVAENIGTGDIDGSILNIVTGVNAAARLATAGATSFEIDLPVVDFGNMSTTVLGAVNTGEISLGLNAAVADAKTRSTEALTVSLAQIGGASQTGALVLNVASNMTGVNGRIENRMAMVSGTIGNLSTTTLGAVNTGTITSGVNATVQGIVGQTDGT